nr:transposase (putative), gypsy type [Tanacetum cinerariifolium]
VARREQRIQARESEIKNLEALLETEADIKRTAEEKSAGLSQELERMRAQFLELQVSNERLSQQVDALQQQVSGEETLKAAFEDYKRQQDQMDFPDVVSTGIAKGIAKGMSEGLKHGVEHGHAQRTIESLGAYDPEAEVKFAIALQSLKDLKLPLLDQLEGLKDAPMDVIMASLYLEDDTGEDALQFIRDLRPSSSQLAIPVYPEKKRSRIVCRTYGVGSAHHARSDRVPVPAPIVVPQGLALILIVYCIIESLWTRSPRPLGLQPAYAANHAPSDPDPLAFADAPSPRPADVIRSSQGVAAAGNPGSENVSSPTEVGSPGSVSGEETLKAAFEDYKRQQDQMVEQRCAEMDARLDAMSIDFDEELYPHMLTAIAGRRWVIGHGLRLATMKCAESLEMRQAFDDVVSAGIAKGMSEGLKHGVEHGHAQR